MGITFCQNNELPIYYNIYPGSIVDVSTLKNCLKYLKIYNLYNILFVLDRGFFSKSNVLEMNNSDNNIQFIQAVPFTKRVKDLVFKSKRKLGEPANSFKFKEEILNYYQTPFDFDNHIFTAHIFFNENHKTKIIFLFNSKTSL